MAPNADPQAVSIDPSLIPPRSSIQGRDVRRDEAESAVLTAKVRGDGALTGGTIVATYPGGHTATFDTFHDKNTNPTYLVQRVQPGIDGRQPLDDGGKQQSLGDAARTSAGVTPGPSGRGSVTTVSRTR